MVLSVSGAQQIVLHMVHMVPHIHTTQIATVDRSKTSSPSRSANQYFRMNPTWELFVGSCLTMHTWGISLYIISILYSWPMTAISHLGTGMRIQAWLSKSTLLGNQRAWITATQGEDTRKKNTYTRKNKRGRRRNEARIQTSEEVGRNEGRDCAYHCLRVVAAAAAGTIDTFYKYRGSVGFSLFLWTSIPCCYYPYRTCFGPRQFRDWSFIFSWSQFVSLSTSICHHLHLHRDYVSVAVGRNPVPL